jgi:Tol biopolymer transport system component
VAKILNEPMPAPRELNASLSPVLEQVILKAIDKDRELRHQGARDLLVDLERLSAAGLAPSSAAGRSSAGAAADGRPTNGRTVAGKRSWLRRGAWLIGAVGLVALPAVAIWNLRPATPRVMSFHTLARRAAAFQGLATDGVNAYFAESRDPTDRLYSVSLSGGDPVEIPLPWSGLVWVRVFDVILRPPALLIGKRAQVNEAFELWRLPLGGASPSRLSGLPRVRSARLSRSGDRIAYVSPVEDPGGHALFVAGIDGAGPRRLLGPHDLLRLQGWTPGDQGLRVLSTEDDTRFLDVSIDGRVSWPETPAGGWGGIVPRRSSDWMTVVPPDWTPDGRFFVWADKVALRARAERPPFWVRRAATATHLTTPSDVTAMRFTPDGQLIVAQVQRPGTEVVRFDPRTGEVSPLLGGARAGVAEFSPDGAWVAWVSNDGGRARLWRTRPDGSSALQLTDPERFDVDEALPVRWSADGRRIAFSAFDDAPGSAVNPQIFVVDVETGAIERPGRPGSEERRFFEADPCWSPDGRSLIYSVTGLTANDAGAYVRRVDLAAGQVNRFPGSEGLWSTKCAPDGRILAFDGLASRAHEQQGGTGRRAFFKLWRPSTKEWSAFSVDLATWSFLNYPTWSRDGRFVYANAGSADSDARAVVRFSIETRRLETVARVDGLRADLWMNLAPDGAPMVHRDVSQHEIVVMDWEVR